MRKNRAEKRKILSDPTYDSQEVAKTINILMWDGKKNLAQNILYTALKNVGVKTKKEPLEVFKTALNNIGPSVELKVRRIAGANYQVPVEVKEDRKITLAIRWLINYARLRNEKTMIDRLTNEIIDASNGVGGSVKKKEDTHKMAEANKAFANLRF